MGTWKYEAIINKEAHKLNVQVYEDFLKMLLKISYLSAYI